MNIIKVEKNKLTEKKMSNFLCLVENPLKITFDEIPEIEILTTKEELQKTLFGQDIIDILQMTDNINIADESNMIKFNKYDYDWWNKDDNRRAKLLSGLNQVEKKLIVEKKIVEEKKYIMATGIKTENDEIEKFQIFEGTEKELLKWINGQLQILTIETFFGNNKIVICLNPNEETKVWYTIEELITNGVFEVK